MKILVVGLGAIAQRHIKNIKALEPSAELAVWRQRPESSDRPLPVLLPEVDLWMYAWQQARDWEPDAAIIANPASMHIETALMLAAEMVHLFIEKPISHSLWQVGQLIDACRNPRCPLVLMVGYDLRFYRPMQLVKDAIDVGRSGRPLHIRCEVGQYLPDWRPGRDYPTSVSARRDLGGGVLLELSHEIDYARWLLGEVASVSVQVGRLSDLEIDVEDTADVLLRFESGALGSLHLDMVDRAPVRRCRVVGTEGSIEVDLLNWEAWLCKAEGRKQLHYKAGPREDPHLAEMRHFLACCRGEAQPPVGGEEGRRVLEIVLAAKRSADEGRVVEI